MLYIANTTKHNAFQREEKKQKKLKNHHQPKDPTYYDRGYRATHDPGIARALLKKYYRPLTIYIFNFIRREVKCSRLYPGHI